jgi:glutamate N-acetyltransferase/amino-acid N-acetyltransferase
VGLSDAERVSRDVSGQLRISDRQLLVASTGLIGRRLPVERIRRVIPALVEAVSRRGHRHAAEAILTTDRTIKEAAVAERIAGRLCHVGGMAKGAGMIAPNMATMLCVLTTDAAIEPTLLEALLREAVEASFNRISVDGDMSTNDSVFLLANGCSGLRGRRGTRAVRQVARMVHAVTQRLARSIIQDGEGATRVAAIQVQGAKSEAEAQACARQVGLSSLVRTMLAGGDPNVGRIAAAVGTSGASFRPQRLEIRVDGQVVVHDGTAVPLQRIVARRLFRSREVAIHIHLHAGQASGTFLTCDLTEAYVRLNARYPS